MSRYNSMEQHISIPLSLFQELALDSKVLDRLGKESHDAFIQIRRTKERIEKEEMESAD